MTTLTDLQQMMDEAWAYAHQSRHDAREARLRAHMAVLWLSMPEANSLTLTITATVLVGHGLLGNQPP